MNKRNSTFNRLIQENHARFFAFVQSRIGGAEAAEDILHTAYRKALERRMSLRDDEKIVAWFYRILRNSIIDHYRSKGSDKNRFVSEDEAENLPVEPDHSIEKAICKCVESLIPALKPEYADAIKEVELNGLSVTGYAKKKKIKPNNATVQLYRARQSLKKKLIETCGSCAEHACLDCNCRSV